MALNELLQKVEITIPDIEAAHNLTYQAAAKLMREIKDKVGDRLNRNGRLYVLDYCEFYGIDYTKILQKREA